MIIHKAYKFRLKTKPKHLRLFAQFAGCCRLAWNKALAFQKERLVAKQSCLAYGKLTNELTSWKQSEKLKFLNNVHSQILQQTLKNLSQALKEAFDKSNPKQFPRFKKKGNQDSFRYPQGFKVDPKNSRVYLPKIGWVCYIKSQELEGTPKNITISRRGQHWYVSIQVEIETEDQQHSSESIVAGDLGIARFLTLSDGTFYAPLNIFRSLAGKLKRLQRQLAKKQKNSSNWRKHKQKITQLHIKIANSRLDYLHKISSTLSKNHAVVMLEDLQISNMSKSAKGTVESPGKNVKAKSGLSKSILDQGWHEFVRQVGYKLDWAGGRLVLVNPRNTSRCCPKCGYTSAENRKTQALFCCIQCNHSQNADEVGATNILRAGHAQLACGEISLENSMKQEPTEKLLA
jgi:putative transposase